MTEIEYITEIFDEKKMRGHVEQEVHFYCISCKANITYSYPDLVGETEEEQKKITVPVSWNMKCPKCKRDLEWNTTNVLFFPEESDCIFISRGHKKAILIGGRSR